MAKARDHARWLAGKVVARRAAFRRDYLDFERGIRMGHLQPEERITQILKKRLAERHGARMICDRWGRGVYWQWICWVPEPNRKAKPLSSAFNFGSAKFFISIDREDRVFQSGMQIERAPRKPGKEDWDIKLEKDWDWHVLLKALRGRKLPQLLRRLLREGFRVRAGAFSSLVEYDRKSWNLEACRRRAQRFSASEWGGFQLFWPMAEKEVQATPGPEIVEAILAVFDEVTPVMNLCMYSPCLKETSDAPE
jgi:hypothetical protein